MANRQVTRRLILVAASTSLAALACSDDSDDPTGGAGGSTTSNSGGAGGSSAGGSNAGGSSAGGSNAGGSSAGGGNVGGAGGSAAVCGMAMLVKGSNYDIDPHDLMIPVEDFDLGEAKTYATTVANGHDHEISLTAADFTALKNGETVKKYICLQPANQTDHEFVISCADPNIMPTFQGEIGTPNNCPG